MFILFQNNDTLVISDIHICSKNDNTQVNAGSNIISEQGYLG